MQAHDRIARIELYTRCPDDRLAELIDQARAAVSRQLDSLPGALETALGQADAEPPAPKTVDKIIKALEEATEHDLGATYTTKLEACKEAVAQQVLRLHQH